MSFALMRFLDNVVGRGIILVLLAWHALWAPLRRLRRGPRPVRRILVLKFFGIGSIVNALPMLRVVRQAHPQARLTFLTFSSNREILELLGVCDAVRTLRKDHFPAFALDVGKTIAWLVAHPSDVAIDLEFFSKFSMMLSYFSRARARIGFFSQANLRSALLTHPVPFNHYKQIGRIYLAMAEALGCAADESELHFALPSLKPKEAPALRALMPRDAKPIVTVNVNASGLCPMRKWDAANYARLLGLLLSRHPHHTFVLIGAPGEEAYVAEIERRVAPPPEPGRLVNLAGRTPLPLLLCLLESSVLLVSNDSGPVHLAAGYQTPSLVLFGPETPVLYRPLNAKARHLFKELYCSPCINVLDNKKFQDCTDTRCMNEITVEEVLREIEAHFLGAPPSP